MSKCGSFYYIYTMKKSTATLLFIAAFILLIFPVANMALWIAVASDESKPFETAKAEYLSYFPDFLQNAQLLTVINIALLAAASAFFYKTIIFPKYRLTAIILAAFSALLLMWNAFSLM